MPPLALALLLNRALPWLTVDGRAVLSTLICNNGRVGSVQTLCRSMGLRSRFQLNRLLRREGLPHYEELAGWVCVLYWMLRADGEGTGAAALRALAGQAHMDAASCYRLVRRVTGRCWTTLRDGGTDAALTLFLRRVRPPNGGRAQLPHATSTLPPVPRLEPGPAVAVPPPPTVPANQPQRLELDGGPHGIGVRGQDLAYVTRSRAAAIARLDLATGRLAGSIPLGCAPTCVAFHPHGHVAYVSVQFCDEIATIDTTLHRKTGALPVPGDPFPLVMSQSGRTLLVATNEDRLLSLSPTNGRIMGSLRLPATAHHLALHPAGGRVYVATRAGGSVLEVDTSRCEVLRTFALGGWPQGVVVSPEGTVLYCANEQHGLDVVQLATGKRVATIELDRPVSLALSPDHQFLYAGLVHAGKVAVIDTTRLHAPSLIDTGGRPREFGFDTRRAQVLVVNEAGWIDLLPMNRRGIFAFDRGRPQPATLRQASEHR